MTLDELQEHIDKMYSDKDRERGSTATFLWLCEEFGELASALREGSKQQLAAEFADVIAWLVTLANINDIRLSEAFESKYGSGCPGCGKLVCACSAKP